MLYLIATPIGNLGDLTFRAAETLKNADAIYCEDTRHTLALLERYGIKKPLLPYHKFNERAASEKITERVLAGENIAVVSDAGMPSISDPGEILVNAARAAGVKYTVIPGASAALTALALSGFSAKEFCFLGFLPSKNKEREALLSRYASSPATLIFYAPPHDVKEYLTVLYKYLGGRRAALARELTKIYEEVTFLTLGETPPDPRGEYCLIVEGASAHDNPLNSLTPAEHLARYLAQGLDKNEAVKRTAKDRGVPKNEIYKLTTETKNMV